MKWVELIDQKQFAKAALDAKSETFVMHMSALDGLLSGLSVNPNRMAQITSQFTKNIMILDKYSNFVDGFSEVKVLVLPEQINVKGHAIDIIDSNTKVGPEEECLA